MADPKVSVRNAGGLLGHDSQTLTPVAMLTIGPASERLAAGSQRKPGTERGQHVGGGSRDRDQQQAQGDEHRADRAEDRSPGIARESAKNQDRAPPGLPSAPPIYGR